MTATPKGEPLRWTTEPIEVDWEDAKEAALALAGVAATRTDPVGDLSVVLQALGILEEDEDDENFLQES